MPKIEVEAMEIETSGITEPEMSKSAAPQQRSLRERMDVAVKAAHEFAMAQLEEDRKKPPRFDLEAMKAGTAGFIEPENADDW